jgi:hypothetical protein
MWNGTPWANGAFNSQFPMLSSHGDGLSGESSPEDMPERPNIYESLQSEEAPPPEEDMNPDDEDMIPRQEDPPSTTDLYKPRWVRGKGHDREGWCGRCEGGCWAKLKNSGFWYHRSYTHGISPNTGRAYPPPCQWRLSDGNPSRWEGLCDQCGEWLKVDTTKKGHNSWFRHVVKCHPKNKNKKNNGGIQKRRRSTLTRHPLSLMRFRSPFGGDDIEESSATEDTEKHIPSTLLSEDSPLVQDDVQFTDSPHQECTSAEEAITITTTEMTPEAPIAEDMQSEDPLSQFHTPINHRLLATPLSTPQLSSTPHMDASATPQIETPAPNHHGSMFSLHGLGVQNLMMPFSLNMGLGLTSEPHTVTSAPATSGENNSTGEGFNYAASSSTSQTDGYFTTAANDGSTLHTNGASSPFDHAQHFLQPAFQTPQIIQGFSGLSVAYNGTPGLPSDVNMASITSVPSMEGKMMSSLNGAAEPFHFGSPLDGTMYGSGHNTPDWA